MKDRGFDPDKKLGEKIGKMSRQELCALVSELCDRIRSDVGTGNYRGGIYGYQHSMDNSVVGRLEDFERDQYIKGLVGCASHQLVGDGMACNINNGKIAAKAILAWMEEAK